MVLAMAILLLRSRGVVMIDGAPGDNDSDGDDGGSSSSDDAAAAATTTMYHHCANQNTPKHSLDAYEVV